MEGCAYRAKAVIVASGSEPKDLCVPGENRLRGKGVSKTLALESLTEEEEQKNILGNNAMNVLNTISLKRKHQ